MAWFQTFKKVLLKTVLELGDEKGKIQGPLAHVTIYLGIDEFLDEEWKRAVALGFFLAIIASVIAFLGNLRQPSAAERPRKSDQEFLEEPQETLEKWSISNYLPSPTSIPLDGGTEFFNDFLNKIRPAWWTNDRKEKVSTATSVYKRLIDDWISHHKFKTPFALNVLLGDLFISSFPEPTLSSFVLGNQTLAYAHYFLNFADACYAKDLISAGILHRSVIKATLGPREGEDQVLRHVLFVDHLTQSIILMIRGTADFEDMLVDLLAVEIEFRNGVAHQGLLEQAKLILFDLHDLITDALNVHGYKRLVLTGHSLGAGVAVLCGLLIRDQYPALNDFIISCYVYGCPPVVGPPSMFSESDPLISSLNIFNFVNKQDIIPRTSMRGLELGFRVWTALDNLDEFSFKERIQALFNWKIPETTLEKVQTQLKEISSNYVQMLVPGKCIWLRDNTAGEGNVTLSVVDSVTISTQPMFLGASCLWDHRLKDYKISLEDL